jgi:hypothetical protein
MGAKQAISRGSWSGGVGDMRLSNGNQRIALG